MSDDTLCSILTMCIAFNCNVHCDRRACPCLEFAVGAIPLLHTSPVIKRILRGGDNTEDQQQTRENRGVESK